MATLQAARAKALGLEDESALSWGLNRACYSEDTLVLTENGWRYHHEVEHNERIMIYDPVLDEIRLERPLSFSEYPYVGDMIHFKNSLADLLVTPEHSIIFKTSGRDFERKPWHVRAAQELLKKRVLLPAKAEWTYREEIDEVEIPIFERKNGFRSPSTLQAVKIPMDRWLELTGYYLSEGGMDSKNHYAFTLTQSHKNADGNVIKIRSLLAKLSPAFHVYEYEDKEKIVRWNVSGQQHCNFIVSEFGEDHLNKRIPAKYKNLSRRQLRILFDALFLGDGVYINGRPRVYCTTSKQLAYDVSELATKLGYSANIRRIVDARQNRSPRFGVNLQRSTYRDVGRNQSELVKYEGMVYCFSTSTGFYVTMRNGKISYQGNTFYAAAKRGFKSGGAGAKTGAKEARGEPEKKIGDYYLGDEKAFTDQSEENKGKLYFEIGGKAQTAKDFERQIESRFGTKSNFKKAWEEAFKIVKGYDEGTLKSQREFYEQVYKPRRDVLSKKWTEEFA